MAPLEFWVADPAALGTSPLTAANKQKKKAQQVSVSALAAAVGCQTSYAAAAQNAFFLSPS